MADLHFTEEDWQRVERDTLAWWEGALERPLVFLAVTNPYEALAKNPHLTRPLEYHSNFPLDMPAADVVDCYAPWLAATHFYADSFPWQWVNFGPGILGGFLGARVNSVVEPSETVWFTPSRAADLPDIQPVYDPDNVWWQRVLQITNAWIERYGRMLQVGQTDLGGNLDVLASLRDTQQLLMDLIEQPEEVLRLVNQITALWIRYYDEQAALTCAGSRGTSCWVPMWSPGKTYMLQCDFSYMISPQMFERFVMPDLTAMCNHLDHAFYHLDGKGEIPHLNHLLSLERLRGIQWIPGDGQPPAEHWLDLLKRIRDGGKLCQVFVDPEGALRIVRNLGGKGFLLVVNSYGPEFYEPENVRAFLKELGVQGSRA